MDTVERDEVVDAQENTIDTREERENDDDEVEESNDDDESDESDESDDGLGKISIREGLSVETLQALFGFVKTLDVNASASVSTSAVSSASSSANVNDNAGIGDRHDGDIDSMVKAIDDMSKSNSQQDPPRCPLNLECEASSDLNVSSFKRDGVIRINNVLSTELCDSCLASINIELARKVEDGTDYYSNTRENGFGNVDSKEHRWDMYLNYSGAVRDSLSSIFNSQTSSLSSFFRDLLFGQESEFHELAALVSDKGAFTQRIHADTLYQESCPVVTVFIALQDITPGMGPTVFLPRTHSEDAHRRLRFGRSPFLSTCEYRQALLKKGDVAIMDSRTLHCGDANSEDRRCLLYFSLVNPLFSDIVGGSIFKELALTLGDVSS